MKRREFIRNSMLFSASTFIVPTIGCATGEKNTKPFDESPLPSNAPVKYVLEINAGLVNEWNLNIGDRISY